MVANHLTEMSQVFQNNRNIDESLCLQLQNLPNKALLEYFLAWKIKCRTPKAWALTQVGKGGGQRENFAPIAKDFGKSSIVLQSRKPFDKSPEMQKFMTSLLGNY